MNSKWNGDETVSTLNMQLIHKTCFEMFQFNMEIKFLNSNIPCELLPGQEIAISMVFFSGDINTERRTFGPEQDLRGTKQTINQSLESPKIILALVDFCRHIN